MKIKSSKETELFFRRIKMKVFAIVFAALVSTTAQADGFVCEGNRDSLIVKVYNHTQPTEGTRNAAVMVVSDPSIQLGNKTIARFSDVNSTLSNKGAFYMADVDLRFNDSGRKGELIGGTKLGQLKHISLDVNFSYGEPINSGETAPAILSLIKRNGETIDLDMNCSRYLKN
jgi:hypothetical protein